MQKLGWFFAIQKIRSTIVTCTGCDLKLDGTDVLLELLLSGEAAEDTGGGIDLLESLVTCCGEACTGVEACAGAVTGTGAPAGAC